MFRYLEPRLRASGFQTLNWGYRSVRGDIPDAARGLQQTLRALEKACHFDRVHLVAHSMGAIIARTMLLQTECRTLGRIVMLGPPNCGSRVAARLAPFLGWFCRPLVQLSDHQHSFVRQLPEPEGCEIGIVAAARDRVVDIASTCMQRQKAHIVVDAGHNGMLFRHDVSRLVANFLQTGDFGAASRNAGAITPPNGKLPVRAIR
jgi:pimeloyl-ACP methyl ester carboxylesterase